MHDVNQTKREQNLPNILEGGMMQLVALSGLAIRTYGAQLDVPGSEPLQP